MWPLPALRTVSRASGSVLARIKAQTYVKTKTGSQFRRSDGLSSPTSSSSVDRSSFAALASRFRSKSQFSLAQHGRTLTTERLASEGSPQGCRGGVHGRLPFRCKSRECQLQRSAGIFEFSDWPRKQILRVLGAHHEARLTSTSMLHHRLCAVCLRRNPPRRFAQVTGYLMMDA